MTQRQVPKPLPCLVRRFAKFDAQGNATPIPDLAEADAGLIGGFEVIVKNAEGGDGHTDKIHKIKTRDVSR